MAENYCSSNMFLHKSELEELTGYRMPARQIAWLKGQGIRHWTNATSGRWSPARSSNRKKSQTITR
jgi:Domain of unknown function (DUF4224)